MSELSPAFGILLVDDEPAWLRALGLTLERAAGLTHLLTCTDARQVMEILDASDVGVVLLDLTMPHLSGEELLARIAAALDPKNVEAVRLVAQLWEKTGDKESALNAYRRLVELVPDDKEANDAIKRLSPDGE